MKKFGNLVVALVVISMTLSLASCSSLKKASKKSEELISEKDAKKIAERFSEALLDMDAEVIEELSSVVDDELLTDIEDFSFEDFDGDYSDVYEALLSNAAYEIDEDSFDSEDDEASIDVVFKYVVIEDVIDELEDADELISYIEDPDETETIKMTFKLVYDEDEEEVFVDNADKLIEKFITAFFEQTFEFEQTDIDLASFVTVDWSKDSYLADEQLVCIITCADNSSLDGCYLEVVIESEDSVYLTASSSYNSGATFEFYADVGESFEGGYVTASLYDEFDFISSIDVYVEAVEKTEPINSFHGEYVDGVYSNDQIGFSLAIPEGWSPVDSSIIDTSDWDGFESDYIFFSEDALVYGYNALGPVDSDINDFVDELSSKLDVETVDIEGVKVFLYSVEGEYMFGFIRNGYLFMFGTNDETTSNDILDTVQFF